MRTLYWILGGTALAAGGAAFYVQSNRPWLVIFKGGTRGAESREAATYRTRSEAEAGAEQLRQSWGVEILQIIQLPRRWALSPNPPIYKAGYLGPYPPKPVPVLP